MDSVHSTEIPKSKLQIPNKFQNPNLKKISDLIIEYWSLFVFWCLMLGIYALCAVW